MCNMVVEYRCLQLLSTMHNSGFRQPAMSGIIGKVTICESFALYILITSADIQIPIPVLFLFFLVATGLFILSVCHMKVIAKPFIKSVKFLDSLKALKLSKWTKRFAKFCSPSKLTLGDGKFFDKSTSLVIWKKAVDLLITLLLI